MTRDSSVLKLSRDLVFFDNPYRLLDGAIRPKFRRPKATSRAEVYRAEVMGLI
jgi:hypothetical protein